MMIGFSISTNSD